MKLVFVVGPYRAQTEYEVVQNIRRAESLALKVWQAGAACLCPHKNTAHFGGAAPDDLWLRGAQEMLRHCDAAICVDGWERSSGARAEVAFGKSLKIPVFEKFEELEQWLSRVQREG